MATVMTIMTIIIGEGDEAAMYGFCTGYVIQPKGYTHVHLSSVVFSPKGFKSILTRFAPHV